MSQAKDSLLDHRYLITRMLRDSPGERWYAGMHVQLDVPVRIIVLHPSAAARTPVAPMRSPFWSLAGAAAMLRHASLPRVRDCFTCGGEYCVVTDMLPGEWLDARVERTGPLELREALAMALRLCDALSYVRRSAPALMPIGAITPEQLAVGPDGRVVLADLGMRRWLDEPEPEQPEVSRTSDFGLARATTSATSDGRADLAGIAAVLLFALTGTTASPLGRDRWQSAVHDHELPPALAALLKQGLTWEPAAPLRTPEAFGAALAETIRHTLPAVAACSRRTDTSVRVQGMPDHSQHETTRTQHAAVRLAHDAGRTASRLAEGSLRRSGARTWAAISSALRWIA